MKQLKYLSCVLALLFIGTYAQGQVRVGGGIRYKLESNLVPMAEMKYINGGQDEFVINIGLLIQL